MIKNYIIGFSNGNFYGMYREESDRFLDKYLNAYKEEHSKAIQLHSINEEVIDFLINKEKKERYSNFDYISLHASSLVSKNDECSREILKKLRKIKEKFNLKNIVFHPDVIEDWEVFNDFQDLPISIENMDNEKKFGKTVEDIAYILEKYNFKLTLDLQHCFINDKTMALAKDFHKTLGNRVVEYHLSGYKKGEPHYPLFKTKQDEIINSLELKNIPIIIESKLEKLGEEKQEMKYILDRLK